MIIGNMARAHLGNGCPWNEDRFVLRNDGGWLKWGDSILF